MSFLSCLICRGWASWDLRVCCECLVDFPWLEVCCYRCGLSLSTEQEMCGQCLQKPPLFDRTVAVASFDEPVKQLIHQFKYHQRFSVGRLLANLLVEQLSMVYEPCDLPELIVPMPMHFNKLKQRGFNHAVELARPLIKRFNLKSKNHGIYRALEKPSQSHLSARQRRHNLTEVFSYQGSGLPGHVAIVDDVLTTGSSANALSQCLKQAGAWRVDLWVIARTLRPK